MRLFEKYSENSSDNDDDIINITKKEYNSLNSIFKNLEKKI